MFLCIVGIVHIADSLEQLNRDTENIISIGNQHMCQIGILKYQQLDGLNTVLPYGVNKINTLRRMLLRKKKFITGWSSMDLH